MRPEQSIAGDTFLARKSIFYFLPVDKGFNTSTATERA
jgi:hypothetical protein